eukprot:Awhi_evm1s4290
MAYQQNEVCEIPAGFEPMSDDEEEGVEGERGIKTMMFGGAIAAKGAGMKKRHIFMGLIAAYCAYTVIQKQRKKKIKQRQIGPDGYTRDVMVEVDTYPGDPEGYDVEVRVPANKNTPGATKEVFDKTGKKIAEQSPGQVQAIEYKGPTTYANQTPQAQQQQPSAQQPPHAYAQPAAPYGQPAAPYGQPAAPYGQPAPQPYAQPAMPNYHSSPQLPGSPSYPPQQAPPVAASHMGPPLGFGSNPAFGSYGNPAAPPSNFNAATPPNNFNPGQWASAPPTFPS